MIAYCFQITFWYCSLHMHFHNFHFIGGFDIFQGEMNIGPNPGAILQIGSVGDISDSKMGLGAPEHSGGF